MYPSALCELTQVTYPSDSAVSFGYDAAGRQVSMVDGTGTTTWTWDSANRNTGTGQSAIGQGIGYAFDAEGHRTQMTVGPAGGTGT